MKNKSLTIVVLAILAIAAGCKKSDEVPAPSSAVSNSPSAQQALQSVKEATKDAVENVKQAVQSGVDYTYARKEEFVAKAQADLYSLDQKMKEFSDKASAAAEPVKTEAQNKLQELKNKRTDLDRKLEDVKAATQDNWNDARATFQKAYDDVKDSLK
jgi:hypothetical protein